MIKCLVLGGGLYHGFKTLGIIDELTKQQYIDKDNIQEIVCSSVGCIIGLCYLLDIPYKDCIDFFIKRPWQKIFIDLPIMNIIVKKGIFTIDIYQKSLSNLFTANSMSIDITYKEFFERTNKMFSCSVYNTKTQELEYFNHITTPDLKVIHGMYISCSVPIIFEPMQINNIFYTDALLLTAYPIAYALQKYDDNDIFGVKISGVNDTDFLVKDTDNIILFLVKLFYGYKNKYQKTNPETHKNMINACKPIVSSEIYDTLHSEEFRNRIYHDGVVLAKEYIVNHSSKSDTSDYKDISTNLLNDS